MRFAYIVFSKDHDATAQARLNDNFNNLLHINLDYPFLEDSPYTSHWDRNKLAGDYRIPKQTRRTFC